MAHSASFWVALLLCLNLLLLVTACPPSPPPPSPRRVPLPPPRRVVPIRPAPRVAPAPPPPVAKDTCPVDTLKLGVCDDLLGGLINLQLGTPPKEPCCSLVEGLDDLEAAVCLCTVVKANVLGLINLNIPVDLSLLVNYCGKGVPSGFVCA